MPTPILHPLPSLSNDTPASMFSHASAKAQAQAKVIATLGPASSSPEMITALINAGMSVVRLNMSHGEQSVHLETLRKVRAAAKEAGRTVAVLADLQGPKIRTGRMVDGKPVHIKTGDTIRFELSDEPGDATRITTPLAPIFEVLTHGMRILINDGALRLMVTDIISPTAVQCQIIQGGELNERKGINLPDARINIAALTEKDKADALFAVKAGVDYLALSFVQRAQDIQDLRTYLTEHQLPIPPIIAKIEKPQALEEIDAIFEATDALMVARGDLGVELSPERVPMIQKRLCAKGFEVGKPVIVATQMLESMTHSPYPSRAEVSDVANAVLDGADAVMLSGETATGEFPVEAVTMMRRAIVEAEDYLFTSSPEVPHAIHHTDQVPQAVAYAASFAARKTPIASMVVLTDSGKMARRISKMRPQQPIIALTENPAVERQLALLWGVRPICITFADTTDETINEAEREILKAKLLNMGDKVLFCAGWTPIVGATNMLKFFTIGDAVKSATGLLNTHY